MTEPLEPLGQAQRLVRMDPHRPKAANLRTAVSRAYYALAHLLAGEGARVVVRGRRGAEVRDPRAMLIRCFEHPVMANAARAFAGRARNGWRQTVGVVPPELVDVAEAFIELQDARNLADYDMGHRLTRSASLALVAVCERAFKVWPTIRKSTPAQAFLLALLLRPRT